jgi:HK97 family phage major capsid protein
MITAGEIQSRGADGLRRTLAIRSFNSEARTVEVAFASEAPVDRWFGTEVLTISVEAMRLDRLRNGAAVLLDHDFKEQVGVVDAVRVGTDGIARATLRFGRGAKAVEVFTDIEDGIRQHVSVGYIVHGIDVEERSGEPDKVRVVDWEPLEISIVAVPADASVGVGRSAKEVKPMTTRTAQQRPANTNQNSPAQGQGAGADASRVSEVLQLAEVYGADDLATRILREGGGPDEMRRALLERMNRGGGRALSENDHIGLSETEVRNFSIVRLVRHLVAPDARTAEDAAFEIEASRTFAQRAGRDPDGFYLPPDLLFSRGFASRAMNTGMEAQGGALVANQLLSENFVDALRNSLAVYGAGATILPGLVGNVRIPRLAGGAAHEWLPEAGAASNQEANFDTIAMSPKTIAVSIPITRRLLLQSTPAVEALLRKDIIARVALGIDAAALNGDPSPHAPKSLREAIVDDAVEWSTANKPTFAEIVGLETAVAAANADTGQLAYVYGAAMGGHLKTTPMEPGAPYFIEGPDGMVNGHPRNKSNQAQAGDVFFGNWQDMIIGMWSGLDLRADTATLAASDGLVLRAFQDVDVGIRHAASFALGQNVQG